MQRHLEQALHNIQFQESICHDFGDKFFDWKITISFYTALHWIHALSKMRKINIGSTHDEVSRNINPDKQGASMPINRLAYKHYRELHNYSRAARYDGMTDIATFEVIMKANFSYCEQHLSELRKYIVSQGLPI